jgi:hypothetical protein
MWAQLKPWLIELARRAGRCLAAGAALLARVLAALWRLLRPYLMFALNVLVALLLLFEEWGWRPLSNLLGQLARFRIWAMAELWIAGLPPYGALVALGIPTAILVPAKLFGVYLLALGHIVSAALVLIAAKVASTALIARIFILTKPALMQVSWFKRAYDLFVPWQEALFARIRASWVWRYGRVVKWRAGGYMRRTWRTLRPRLEASWADVKPQLVALGRRTRAGARSLWRRTSLAGGRLMRRLQGRHI